jgi:hypothetical protein
VCASPVPYCVTCRLGVAGKDWETNWVYYKGSRQWLFPPDPTRFSDSDYTDFCLKKVCFFNPFVFYHDRLLACICAYVHAHANAHACACLHMRACRLRAIGFKFCPNSGGACDGEGPTITRAHNGCGTRRMAGTLTVYVINSVRYLYRLSNKARGWCFLPTLLLADGTSC